MRVHKFVNCYNIFALAFLSLIAMSTFMLKIKYNEFLLKHQTEIASAIRTISYCQDDTVLKGGGLEFQEFCSKVMFLSNGNAAELALKDTICFALPFMSVLDRKSADPMIDIIIESDKLFKIGLVLFIVYSILWNFGFFRFGYNNYYQQAMALPYTNNYGHPSIVNKCQKFE